MYLLMCRSLSSSKEVCNHTRKYWICIDFLEPSTVYGSMLFDHFQPCHLNKYFFATWNVWWCVPAIVESQIVLCLYGCSILAQRIFDWVLKKNPGHAHSGQKWATWNLNTLPSWCLLMWMRNWNLWYLVISAPKLHISKLLYRWRGLLLFKQSPNSQMWFIIFMIVRMSAGM
jgi:hypothetical protein